MVMYAVIEVRSVVIKRDNDLQYLLSWLLHNDLATETAGFTPSSCDGGIKPNDNIIIIKLPEGDGNG